MSPLAGVFSNQAKGGQNPAEASRPYMDQIPGYGKEAYNPFIAQGQEAWAGLKPQYEKSLNNPGQMFNEDMAGYQPSEYYKQMAPYLNQAMENTAGAGGYGGTPNDQMQRADMIRQLMSGDIGNYMEGVNHNRTQGMQGYESATGRGAQAAGSLADFLGNAATNRADLEYSGKAQQSNNKSAFFNSLMKAVAQGFGGAAGGGIPGGMGQQEEQQRQQPGQQGLRNIQTRTQTSRPYSNWGGRQ